MFKINKGIEIQFNENKKTIIKEILIYKLPKYFTYAFFKHKNRRQKNWYQIVYGLWCFIIEINYLSPVNTNVKRLLNESNKIGGLK